MSKDVDVVVIVERGRVTTVYAAPGTKVDCGTSSGTWDDEA